MTLRIWRMTEVLPVPGGPCSNVKPSRRGWHAAATARSCDALHSRATRARTFASIVASDSSALACRDETCPLCTGGRGGRGRGGAGLGGTSERLAPPPGLSSRRSSGERATSRSARHSRIAADSEDTGSARTRTRVSSRGFAAAAPSAPAVLPSRASTFLTRRVRLVPGEGRGVSD
jgi:hypothetical protein